MAKNNVNPPLGRINHQETDAEKAQNKAENRSQPLPRKSSGPIPEEIQKNAIQAAKDTLQVLRQNRQERQKNKSSGEEINEGTKPPVYTGDVGKPGDQNILYLGWQRDDEVLYQETAGKLTEEDSKILALITANQPERAARQMTVELKARNRALKRQTTSGFRRLLREAEEMSEKNQRFKPARLGNFISFYYIHGIFLAAVSLFYELIYKRLDLDVQSNIFSQYHTACGLRTQFRDAFFRFFKKAGDTVKDFNPNLLGRYCEHTPAEILESTMLADKIYRKCEKFALKEGVPLEEVDDMSFADVLITPGLAKNIHNDPNLQAQLQEIPDSEGSEVELDVMDKKEEQKAPTKTKRVSFGQTLEQKDISQSDSRPSYSSTPVAGTDVNVQVLGETITETPVPKPRNKSSLDITATDPCILECKDRAPPQQTTIQNIENSSPLGQLLLGLRETEGQCEKPKVTQNKKLEEKEVQDGRRKNESFGAYCNRQSVFMENTMDRLNQVEEELNQNGLKTPRKTPKVEDTPKSTFPPLFKKTDVRTSYNKNPYEKQIRFWALHLKRNFPAPPLWEDSKTDGPELFNTMLASYFISLFDSYQEILERKQIPKEYWPPTLTAVQYVLGVHPVQFGREACDIFLKTLHERELVEIYSRGLEERINSPPMNELPPEKVTKFQDQGRVGNQEENKTDKTFSLNTKDSNNPPPSKPPSGAAGGSGPPSSPSSSSSSSSETYSSSSHGLSGRREKKSKKSKKRTKKRSEKKEEKTDSTLLKKIEEMQNKMDRELSFIRQLEEKQRQKNEELLQAERMDTFLNEISSKFSSLQNSLTNKVQSELQSLKDLVDKQVGQSDSSDAPFGSTRVNPHMQFFGNDTRPGTIEKDLGAKKKTTYNKTTTFTPAYDKTYSKEVIDSDQESDSGSDDYDDFGAQDIDIIDDPSRSLAAIIRDNPDQTAKDRYLARHRNLGQDNQNFVNIRDLRSMPVSERLDKFWTPPPPSRIDWNRPRNSRARRLMKDEFPPEEYYTLFFPNDWARPPSDAQERRAGDNEKIVRNFKAQFSGKVQDYPIWKTKFRSGVHAINVKISTKVEVLYDCLDENKPELAGILPRRDNPSWDVVTYCTIIKYLENSFGGTDRQAKYYREQLLNMPKLSNNDYHTLESLRSKVKNCVDILIDRGEQSWVESREFYERLFKKFTKEFRLSYVKHCENHRLLIVDFYNLYEFLVQQVRLLSCTFRAQGYSSAEEKDTDENEPVIKKKKAKVEKPKLDTKNKSKGSKVLLANSQPESRNLSENSENDNEGPENVVHAIYPADLIDFINEEDEVYADVEFKAYLAQQTQRRNKFKPPECPKCKENHLFIKCDWFLGLTPSERAEYMAGQKRCFNCFQVDHVSRNCPMPAKCREKLANGEKCDRRHHTLLHGSQFRVNNAGTETAAS